MKKEKTKQIKDCFVGFFAILFIFMVICCFSDEHEQKQSEQSEPIQKELTIDEKVRVQFSKRDGSHIKLTQLIKASMNDPKSYEFVSIEYLQIENYLIVHQVFRGKNAFGSIVLNDMRAKYSLDGELLEVF